MRDGSPDDQSCGRSSDSLAAELGQLSGAPVLNLACPGATISAGLRGPRQRGPQLVPPQLGLLKQVQDLRFVAVVVGPNDIGWTDFLTYCYGVANCSDNLSQGEFDYRLAAFDRDYGDLLQDLAALPGRPTVRRRPRARPAGLHRPRPVPPDRRRLAADGRLGAPPDRPRPVKFGPH